MEQSTAAANDGEEEELFPLIDGIHWLSEWGSESLHFALAYQARPDDLFIVTYPRSGTTWMQNIVYNLQTGGQPFDADRNHFFEQNPTLELDGEDGIEVMQRPGAIKTHLPMNRVSYHPLAKYICVIRNPKDVCLSYYLFYKTLGEVPKLEFDQFVEYFIQGRLLLNDYFEGLRLAWERRNEDNVLLVSYEEMRTDLRAVIHKVANFLSIILSDELLERVMHHSSFDYMKDRFDAERRLFEAEMIDGMEDEVAAAQRREKFRTESEMKIVRKGEINDWKSCMTPEQSRRIHDRFVETCKRCDGLESYWSKWEIFQADTFKVQKS